MAAYGLTQGQEVIRNSDGLVFLPVPHEPAWAGYMIWLREGGVPDPSPVLSVTPRQARLALLSAGLLDQVEAIIAQADRATQITWSDASEIRRDFPLIASLGSALGLTTAQINALFINAAKL